MTCEASCHHHTRWAHLWSEGPVSADCHPQSCEGHLTSIACIPHAASLQAYCANALDILTAYLIPVCKSMPLCILCGVTVFCCIAGSRLVAWMTAQQRPCVGKQQNFCTLGFPGHVLSSAVLCWHNRVFCTCSWVTLLMCLWCMVLNTSGMLVRSPRQQGHWSAGFSISFYFFRISGLCVFAHIIQAHSNWLIQGYYY